MKSFSELPLSAPLRSNLAKHGFIDPTPVQALAIEPALAGRDLVATAQTGTGKTLAFVLPILQLLSELPKQPATSGIRAIVLSPTRELAMQINETFVKMAAGTGIRASIAVGGLSENAQLRNIRNGSQVLIATPGRLSDFMGRNLVDLRHVRILVLDEADRMLDMGFLPTVKKIIAATPSDRQTLLFSATIQSSVKHLVQTHVRNAVRIEVGDTSKPIEKIELHLYEVEQDRKLGLLQPCWIRSKAPSWFSPAPSTAPTSWRRNWRARAEDHGHPRQSQPKPAHPGAAGLPGWRLSRAGGNRRGLARDSCRRNRARSELRSSAGSRGLHSSRRPNRTRRRHAERLRPSPRDRSARKFRRSSGRWTPNWCAARFRRMLPWRNTATSIVHL